ncbi:MAG: alanine--glyoxylate aminotransferase family protein [Chloroflexia bacterium]|nr:alanine--glyoxylate aminotransferase family protein [Chloroflexia bacterium]
MTIPTTTATDPRLTQGRWLRIPGPTVVHPNAVQAQTRDMIAHRGPAMYGFMHELREKARVAHRTESEMLFWAGSGSAGWETGIVNLLSPGDTVVATVGGAFGERFAWLGEKLGLDVRRVEVEWGKAVTPEAFGQALDAAGDVKAAFITHNETSTGITNPLKELAALARAKGALVLVDAVSSAGAMELNVDEWDLDWTFSGVQKAWMCPPGLMMAAVSERAIRASETAGFKRFYFDLAPMLQAAREGSTATTPAISLLFALDAAMDAIHEEGLEQVWERHIRLGKAFRAGLEELRVEVLAEPGYQSASVTAFHTPNGMTSSDFQGRITDATGIVIATGQGPLAKTVNRVGHMGWSELPELDATLEAIGQAMR